MSVSQSNQEDRDDQIRRTARVLEIVQQIAVRPLWWTRRALASHHEVSERMITKDLELIRQRLRLPLAHTAEGYYFEQLPHLPTTTYAFSEALALLAAARAAQAAPGIDSAELAAAIGRLEALFPQELRPLLRQGWDQLPYQAVKAHLQQMLALLHRGLLERRQVRIWYATHSRGGQVSERLVEPYHLMLYGRSWHLIAFDHLRKEVLQFKVDRVQQAQLEDETYSVPPDFDVNAYLGDTWGLMRGAAAPVEDVVLHFEPEAGRRVIEETWHHSQQCQPLPDGRVEVRFHVGATPEMVGWLLQHGADVRIVAPDWLRRQVAEAHRAAYQAAAEPGEEG